MGRFEELLEAELPPSQRAEILVWAARCSMNLRPTTSLRFSEELTTLGRQLGDETMVARGLVNEAYAHSMRDPHRAVALLDEALPLARRLHQDDLVVYALIHKNLTYKWFCRPQEATDFAEEALRVAEQAGWAWGAMRARAAIALTALWAGRPQQALEEARVVASFADERSYPLLAVLAGIALCEVAYHRGEPARRRQLTRTCRGLSKWRLIRRRLCRSCEREGAHFARSSGRRRRARRAALIRKVEALGLARALLGVQADLVEIALRAATKRQLDGTSWRATPSTSGSDEPWLCLARQAGARLARAEGEFSRATRWLVMGSAWRTPAAACCAQ